MLTNSSNIFLQCVQYSTDTFEEAFQIRSAPNTPFKHSCSSDSKIYENLSISGDIKTIIDNSSADNLASSAFDVNNHLVQNSNYTHYSLSETKLSHGNKSGFYSDENGEQANNYENYNNSDNNNNKNNGLQFHDKSDSESLKPSDAENVDKSNKSGKCNKNASFFEKPNAKSLFKLTSVEKLIASQKFIGSAEKGASLAEQFCKAAKRRTGKFRSESEPRPASTTPNEQTAESLTCSHNCETISPSNVEQQPSLSDLKYSTLPPNFRNPSNKKQSSPSSSSSSSKGKGQSKVGKVFTPGLGKQKSGIKQSQLPPHRANLSQNLSLQNGNLRRLNHSAALSGSPKSVQFNLHANTVKSIEDVDNKNKQQQNQQKQQQQQHRQDGVNLPIEAGVANETTGKLVSQLFYLLAQSN
ncbi:uncharacterized protein LOC142349955 [Convolutriloba macropyga]|uniref:uncharacterized protein LOC142349955 n=1 Tax=Convolutriloba macropyga TaxID=536237 RepID=UPI003F51E083